MAKRRWSDLSDKQKLVVGIAASVQISLAASAWADLATRPAEQVNGKKGLWAAVIAVNVVGPLAYFTSGRRHQPVHQPTL